MGELFFILRSKDTIVETYFICLNGRLLNMETFKKYNIFTLEERDVLYSLINDPTSILKISDKDFVEVVRGRVNYLKKV